MQQKFDRHEVFIVIILFYRNMVQQTTQEAKWWHQIASREEKLKLRRVLKLIKCMLSGISKKDNAVQKLKDV